MDPQIVSSIIGGGCTVFATVVGAVTAALIGKRFADMDELRRKLDEARKDVEFLLAVEEVHCDIHREMEGSSSKNKIRDLVRSERGLEWSGRNTPGRLR